MFSCFGWMWDVANVYFFRVSYPHMTAALCAGCIQPCTCRLWWSGRWADTAGSSLHCCDCTDWCLGSRKHTRSKIKGGLTETRADVLRANRLQVAITTTRDPQNVFGKVISAEQTGCEKEEQQQRKSVLHLSAPFHCRFSCASWGTCCCAGLSSCRRPPCRRFRSGRFPDRPTTAYLLNDAAQQRFSIFSHSGLTPNSESIGCCRRKAG